MYHALRRYTVRTGALRVPDTQREEGAMTLTMKQANHSKYLIGSYISYVSVYFFGYLAMGAFIAVLPVYLADIGKTPGELSFIISASSCFSLIVGPLTGYLCDSTKRPRFISGILMACMGLFSILFALCMETWLLFLLQGAAMSFYSATMPVSEQLAGVSPYRYGILRIWGTIGYAIGAQAAGIAVQSLPPLALFVFVAAAAFLTTLSYAWVGKPVKKVMPREIQPESASPKLTSLLKNPHFLLYLLITLLAMGCSNVNSIYLPLLLNDFGVPTSVVGTALSIGTLVELPIILFSNKFMDRFSSKTLLMADTGIFTLQYLLYALTDSPWIAIVTLVLLKAISTTLLAMLNLKVVRNLVNPAVATVGLSIVNAGTGFGTIVLQNAGGAFADRFPIQALYLIMTGFSLFTILLSLLLKVENKEKVFS